MAEPFLGMTSAIRLDSSVETIDSDVFILDLDDVLAGIALGSGCAAAVRARLTRSFCHVRTRKTPWPRRQLSRSRGSTRPIAQSCKGCKRGRMNPASASDGRLGDGRRGDRSRVSA